MNEEEIVKVNWMFNLLEIKNIYDYVEIKWDGYEIFFSYWFEMMFVLCL